MNTGQVFPWGNVKDLSPLSLQVIDKRICPSCHTKTLQDRSTRELVVWQCSECYTVYILEEK